MLAPKQQLPFADKNLMSAQGSVFFKGRGVCRKYGLQSPNTDIGLRSQIWTSKLMILLHEFWEGWKKGW